MLEAVFLASPSLYESLALWRAAPDSKKGMRAERALVRYIYRMAARATPFGLFSGCSLGPVALGGESEGTSATRLAVAPRGNYERHTRLDMDYLFALCEDLSRDPALREELLYRPNTSLYRAAGRLRYAEARLDKKVRSHHLVAVEENRLPGRGPRCASQGARIRRPGHRARRAGPGRRGHPRGGPRVHRRADRQPAPRLRLSTPVTGPEPIHDLIEQLRLRATRATAAAPRPRCATRWRPSTPGARATARALPGGARHARGAAGLGRASAPLPGRHGQAAGAHSWQRAVSRRSLAGSSSSPHLRQGGSGIARPVPRGFNERYEGREVPLLEVLDEEIGIGFERSATPAAEASPLLGLALASPAGERPSTWDARHRRPRQDQELSAACGARRRSSSPPRDLERHGAGRPGGERAARLPDALPGDGLHSPPPSPDALAAGEFQVLFERAGGPSGARLLGRFCHADPALDAHVLEHLRARGGAAARRDLRRDRAPPRGAASATSSAGRCCARTRSRSSAAPARRASSRSRSPISWSRSCGHADRPALPAARHGGHPAPDQRAQLRAAAASASTASCARSRRRDPAGGLGWSWGPLDSAPFLPRVTAGRLVLSRAPLACRAEIEALARPQGRRAFRRRPAPARAAPPAALRQPRRRATTSS